MEQINGTFIVYRDCLTVLENFRNGSVDYDKTLTGRSQQILAKKDILKLKKNFFFMFSVSIIFFVIALSPNMAQNRYVNTHTHMSMRESKASSNH